MFPWFPTAGTPTITTRPTAVMAMPGAVIPAEVTQVVVMAAVAAAIEFTHPVACVRQPQTRRPACV